MTINDIVRVAKYCQEHTRAEAVKKFGQYRADCMRGMLGLTKGHKELTDEQRAEIIALVEAGVTHEELAERFGCSTSGVQYIASKAGVESPNHKKWTARDLAGMRNLRAKGWSYEDVARRLGRTLTSVLLKAHKMGMHLTEAERKQSYKVRAEKRRKTMAEKKGKILERTLNFTDTMTGKIRPKVYKTPEKVAKIVNKGGKNG